MNFNDLLKKIDKKEWSFVLLMIVIMIIVTTFPYLYAYFSTPPNLYWLGTHSLTSADIPFYYSFIEQAKQGHWLFRSLMTSEPHPRLLFNPLFIGMGWMAKIFNLSNTAIFQLTRIILIPFCLVILYIFISYFFEEKNKRKICFIFLLFSSGLGAVFSGLLYKIATADPVLFWYFWPMDLWTPESNTFLTLYHNPLHIVALILIVLTFLFLLLALENNKVKYSIGAGLCGLLLFLVHPYHVPTIYGVTGVYLAIQFLNRKIAFRYVKHYLILIAISLPSVIYHLLLLKYDWARSQTWKGWFGYTPSPWVALISYGFPLLFAVAGILILRKNKFEDKKLNFLTVWLVLGWLLIYAWFLKWPRRLTHGLQVPMIILATLGIFWFYNYLRQKLFFKKIFGTWVNPVFLLPPTIFIFSFSIFFILASDLDYFNKKATIFYITQEKKQALDWLKKNTSENSVILASPFIGNLVPGFAGRITFVGHNPETANYFQKYEEAILFFKFNSADTWKEKFLKKIGINYIFWSGEEKNMGEFKPKEKKYLKKVYGNNEVEIYKVINN